MKKKIKAKFDLGAKTEVIAMAEGSSASFIADPICTSLPFLNANRFAFTKESLQKRASSMSRKPLNFMHEQKNIVGHVEKSGFGFDNEGRVTAFASGTMYSRIFPDLVEKMTRKDGFEMFKVSVEASFEDFSWILHTEAEADKVGEDLEVVHAGSDPDLDDIGLFSMWLFGTVRGLKHRGKDVALLLGGESESYEFIGLAVTDELAGSAADQNARISVLASEMNGPVQFASKASMVKEADVTEFVLSMMIGDEASMEKFGVTKAERDLAVEEFKKSYGSILSAESMFRSPEDFIEEVEVPKELQSEVVVSEDGDEDEDEDGEEEGEAEPEVIPGEIIYSEDLLEKHMLAAVSRQDELTREYVKKIDSFIVKMKKKNRIIARKDKKIEALSAQIDADRAKLEDEIKCIKDEFVEIKEEILALRKFELASLDSSDLAIRFEDDLKKMSYSAYVDFKKKFVGRQEKEIAKIDFEEQTRRAIKK